MLETQIDSQDNEKSISAPVRWLVHMALFVLVSSAYLPSVGYGFLDDESVILFRMPPPHTAYEVISRSFTPHFPGLPYLRPVPHATYLIQYMWNQNDPGPFHAFNVALIGVTACCVFSFLSLPSLRIGPGLAIIGALVFSLHPATSSAVLPIVGRETLLTVLFTVAALNFYARTGDGNYNTSIMMMILAMLSKEQAVVIPGLFFLADICGVSEAPPQRILMAWVRRYRMAVVVTLGYLAIRWASFSGAEFQLHVLEQPGDVLLSVRHAIQTVFAPSIELMYEPHPMAWISNTKLIFGIAILCCLATGVFRSRRSLLRRSVFCIGWSFLSIAPTANIIQQQAQYSERYVVLAIMAAIVLTLTLLARLMWIPMARRIIFAVCLIVVVIAGATTVGRGRFFATQMAFAKQWSATNPYSVEAQMSLGFESWLAGDFETAEAFYRHGMNLQSDRTSTDMCRMWTAKMLILQDRFEEAASLFQQMPTQKFALLRTAMSLDAMDRTDEAEAMYRRAIETDHSFFSAHHLLAMHFLRRRKEGSERHFQFLKQASTLDVSFADVSTIGLDRIAGYPVLKVLILSNTAIGDSDVQKLAKIATLKQLALHGTDITDAAVATLAATNLQSLVISDTRITDASIKSLIRMSHLRHLDMRYTEISDAGVDVIRQELPECMILWEKRSVAE